MFEKYRDAEQLSCKCVLDKKYIAKLPNGSRGWKDLDDETCYELFNLFKEFVAKTARGGRRNRILNASMEHIESCGILGRLYYNFDRERVEYIAGQDYISEMGILRDQFDWEGNNYAEN